MKCIGCMNKVLPSSGLGRFILGKESLDNLDNEFLNKK
jgi:hypothetical protein